MLRKHQVYLLGWCGKMGFITKNDILKSMIFTLAIYIHDKK
jgi:hypothetical protein